jgi:molybdate transport system regulatory protein
MGADAVTDTKLTLRIDFGARRSVGPGKIRLLEAIGATGSIAKAGRSLGMSYRRAWLLIDDMNRCFRHAVINAKPGGSQGGGAVLTRFGSELIRDYRAIERAAVKSAKTKLRGLESALEKPRKAGGTGPRKISVRGTKR